MQKKFYKKISTFCSSIYLNTWNWKNTNHIFIKQSTVKCYVHRLYIYAILNAQILYLYDLYIYPTLVVFTNLRNTHLQTRPWAIFGNV